MQRVIAVRLNLWCRVKGNGDDRGQAIAAARTAGYRPSSKQPSSGDHDAHPTDPDRPSRRADRPFGLLQHSRQKHDLRPPGRIARSDPNSAELIGTPAFLGEGGVQLRDGYGVSSHLIPIGITEMRRIAPTSVRSPKIRNFGRSAQSVNTNDFRDFRWSEWQDSNLRPPRPERGALPGCATLRDQRRSV